MEQSFTVVENHFDVGSGMSVFYKDYSPRTNSDAVPLVYLPGLMRTARDFDRVAPRLAAERRVITIDTRGRGKGGRSANPADYRFDALVDDVWTLTEALGVQQMVLAGLAIGVFMSWRMAASRPGRIRGIIANDTGTETFNPLGKKMVALADHSEYSLDEATEKLRIPNEKGFPDFGLDDWRIYARQVYGEISHGKWVRDFDPGIHVEWERVKTETPSLWDEFVRVGDIPVAICRGENSQFLTREHAEKRAAALPSSWVVNFQGRAHPLLLDEPASLAAIRKVLALADGRSA